MTSIIANQLSVSYSLLYVKQKLILKALWTTGTSGKKILKRRNVVMLSANTALSGHNSAEVQRQTILVVSRTKRGIFPKYNLSLNEKAICFWLTPERQTTFVNWWYVYRVKTVSHCSLMAPKQNYLAKQLTTNNTLAPPPTHIDKITPHTQVLLSQQIKREREKDVSICFSASTCLILSFFILTPRARSCKWGSEKGQWFACSWRFKGPMKTRSLSRTCRLWSATNRAR